MSKLDKNNINGFTLIELLVVISILGVLSAIGTININGGIVRARSAKKMADINMLTLGLNIYQAKNFGFPSKGIDAPNQDAANWESLQTILGTSGIIPPQSAKGMQYCYYINNTSNPTKFILVATDFEDTLPNIASTENPTEPGMTLIADSKNQGVCLGLDGQPPSCAAPYTVGGTGKDYCIKSVEPSH
jgi:prepilin-type N-terminal cleavage/methylation domain-containing protein